MKILTVDNTGDEVENVPDEIDNIRDGIVGTSDHECLDNYFLPIIFLESFYEPSICLHKSEHSIQVRKDGSRTITDEE